jgi:hypothetical protein
MVRHLVDRHRVALDDAALADLVAVAVEEGDGEVVLVAPVAGGFDWKAGMASASITTEPPAAMVKDSLRSSMTPRRQPLTRKRRKKMVAFSQNCCARKRSSYSDESSQASSASRPAEMRPLFLRGGMGFSIRDEPGT